MNAAQRHDREIHSGIKTKTSLLGTGNVFVSLPMGQLSAAQLMALVEANEKFLQRDHIEITANLNIHFGFHEEKAKQAIFQHFIKSGLLILGCDSAIPHQGNCEDIRDEDKVVIANVKGKKMSTSTARQLAEMMQSEGVSDIHLVNDKEFVFIYRDKGDIHALTGRLKRMGINVRAVL